MKIKFLQVLTTITSIASIIILSYNGYIDENLFREILLNERNIKISELFDNADIISQKILKIKELENSQIIPTYDSYNKPEENVNLSSKSKLTQIKDFFVNHKKEILIGSLLLIVIGIGIYAYNNVDEEATKKTYLNN